MLGHEPETEEYRAGGGEKLIKFEEHTFLGTHNLFLPQTGKS